MKAFRTLQGPVDLRQKRDKLAISGGHGNGVITRNWLQGLDDRAVEYRKAVKKAMLIAARQIVINDSLDPSNKKEIDVAKIEDEIGFLKRGGEDFLLRDTSQKRKKLEAVVLVDNLERHLLIKYSKRPCCTRRERWFVISNGELRVYRHKQKGRVRFVEGLKDATMVHEFRIPGTYQLPRFEEGYQDRLRLSFPKREMLGKSDVYLYPKGKQELHTWKHACAFARVLGSDSDKANMHVVLGRAATACLNMAWQALFHYHTEWSRTKAGMHTFLMRMQSKDIARGWIKLKLVGKKLALEQDQKAAQRVFCIKYMSERLRKTSGMTMTREAELRDMTVTRIQRTFREYREARIFDRTYPLGSSIKTRMKRIRNGMPVNVSMETLSCDQVLSLSFASKYSLDRWHSYMEVFRTKNSTYSEEFIPTASVDVRITDNFHSLEIYSHESDARFTQFSKTSCSPFINVDRISSVVLHSPPRFGSKILSPDGDAGVWCTVYGPRVAWGKGNIKVDEWATTSNMSKPSQYSGKAKQRVQSVEIDGLVVPQGLSDPAANSYQVNWISVRVTDSSSANLSKSDFDETSEFYIRFHLLGWNFTSKRANQRLSNFEFPSIEATIPVPRQDVTQNEKRILETQYLSAEVFQVSQLGTTTLILIGQELLAGFVSGPHALRLVPPNKSSASGGASSLSMKVESEILDWDEGRRKVSGCVSPEFVGGGITASLYTSHRGAWFDALHGPDNFNLEHCANFIQLNLIGMRLPAPADTSNDQSLEMYLVRASLFGVSVMSPARHRAKPIWGKVLGKTNADPSVINFRGVQLFVPLPPGCWRRDSHERPVLDIEIIRSVHEDRHPVNYEEFVHRGSAKLDVSMLHLAEPPPHDANYHCRVSFEGMPADQLRNVSAFLSKGEVTAIEAYHNLAEAQGPEGGEAVINIEVGLRDRDYVRSTMGVAGAPRGLCVGDKVMLVCEEPVTYPQDEKEWKQRFCQGQWDPSMKEWPGGKMPLREPCTGTEWLHSGYGDIYRGAMAHQMYQYRSIPSMCHDIVPHKFVMPVSEAAFIEGNRPGIWPRILEDLVAGERGGAIPAAPQRKVVNHLTHIKRQVPCLLLAMYADGTSDVEVAPEFLEQWRKQKLRQYALPGEVVVGDNVSEVPHGGMRTGRCGTSQQNTDPTLPPRKRAVLLKVPSGDLVACHSAGFNIYDACFKGINDVLDGPPPAPDCFVRESEVVLNESFAIAAGPVPPDVGPAACQYEWSLQVRTPNEFEMYSFVASLRHCVRVDQTNQANRIQDYRSRSIDMLHKSQPLQFLKKGGTLEVVLVEARRLKPLQFSSTYRAKEEELAESFRYHKGPLKERALSNLAGTVGSEAPMSRSTPDGHKLDTLVEFRIINPRAQPGEKDEWKEDTWLRENSPWAGKAHLIIPFRNMQVQTAPIVEDTDSPSWALQPQCVKAGGYAFKTGHIDEERLPDLTLDFVAVWAGGGVTSEIGTCKLPVFKENKLNDPEQPIQSIWLPLAGVQNGTAEEAKAVSYPPLGELHILTRWIPAEKLILPPGQQQLTVRQVFEKELWPKLQAQRAIEPLYDLEVQYLSYNPNIVREGRPESPADQVARHVELLYNNEPYLKCLEDRQNTVWFNFFESVRDEEYAVSGSGADMPLYLLRSKWTKPLPDGSVSPRLREFNDLIKHGIPASLRETMWLDITMAKAEIERHVEPGPDLMVSADKAYETYQIAGRNQKSEAQLQLHEDVFHLCTMESSTPPRPDLKDILLARLLRAQNVCGALLAFPESGMVYCESLLILAFFLLLPQGTMVPEFQLSFGPDWMSRLDQNLRLSGVHQGVKAYLKEDSELKVYDCYRKEIPYFFYGAPPTEDAFPLTVVDDRPKSFSEGAVFWLMHTLIGSGPGAGLKDYFGLAVPRAHEAPQLWAGSGVMQDVELLECQVAFHDKELWMHLNATGFQLNMVFYGCFSRLFATFMPTASVFRFWDILFSRVADADQEKPPRSCLLSLAYGVIHSKRDDLMLCQSVNEVTAVLIGAMGSLYDVCTIHEIIEAADTLLWSGFFLPRVTNLLEDRDEVFKVLHLTTAEQNRILKALLQDRDIGKLPRHSEHDSTGNTGVSTLQVTSLIRPMFHDVRRRASVASGSTPKGMLHSVMSGMSNESEEETDEGPYWAMHRPMPLTSQLLSSGVITQAVKYVQRSLRTWSNSHVGTHYFANSEHALPRLVRPPISLIRECDSRGESIPSPEPVEMDQLFMEEALGYDIPSWRDSALELWQSFTNHREIKLRMLQAGTGTRPIFDLEFLSSVSQSFGYGSRVANMHTKDCISTNEMIIAMLCCSKGTLGEKASALFGLFDHPSVPLKAYHTVPTSPLTKSLIEEEMQAEEAGKAIQPPEPEVMENCALRFQVFSNRPIKRHVVGQVYIQSLGSYVGYNPDESEVQTFNMFGPPPAGSGQTKRNLNRGKSGVSGSTSASSLNTPAGWDCVGELRMAITWMPSVPDDLSKGQLCIRLKSISFYRRFEPEPARKNPWVEVATVKHGKDVQIPRWDPRRILGYSDEHASRFATGAYGGHIHFAETMREVGHRFHKLWQHGDNQGWYASTQTWEWNEVWGKQFSVTDHEFEQQFITIPGSSNALDLAAVRIIVQCILQRSMLNLSNRSAILIADSVFNRQGVVPGILEAVITPEDVALRAIALNSGSGQSCKLSAIKSKSKFCACTAQIVLEHERQIAENGGMLNLFYEEFYKSNGGCSLKKMNITCHFGGKRTLWIRYVRAGDGERCLHGTPISWRGEVIWDLEGYPAEVPFDLGKRCSHTVITKSEFISCMLNSPLLGESLRRMASSDIEHVPRKPVQVDVTIMDPHHEEEGAGEMDEALHVQQSILLEVWDSDIASKDFIGEAWLPALSTMGRQMRDYVLPLQAPDFSDEAENGPSRHWRWKEAWAKDAPKDGQPNNQITGDVFIKASWVYPAYQVDGAGQCVLIESLQGKKSPPALDSKDPKNRGKIEEKRHTGMLTMKLERAQMLRRADASKGRDCDPQVTLWVRNDVMDDGRGRWRKRHLHRSKTVRNNRNPKWDEAPVSFEIMQGEFESRFPPQDNTWFEAAQRMTMSRRKLRHMQEDRAAAAVKKFGEHGLEIRFGVRPNGQEGCNHEVDLWMSNSIREFTQKLTQACESEMNYWRRTHGENHKNVARYQDIKIGWSHLVMVYVPPRNLSNLRSQGLEGGEEYKRQYSLSLLDPLNWQPLDPMQSFEGYAHTYHFGKSKAAPKLQVLEATESYKLTNLRYKTFEEERMRVLLKDKNDADKCFGWAEFEHEQDGTTEWRPAMISRFNANAPTSDASLDPLKATSASTDAPLKDKSPSAAAAQYRVSWLFPKMERVPTTETKSIDIDDLADTAASDMPLTPASEEIKHVLSAKSVVLDASKVILAPRNPKMAVWFHPKHEELLGQAKGLRTMGKSDFEIEAILQKSLDDDWKAESDETGTTTEQIARTKPPKITVDIVRNYLNHHH